MRGLLYTLESLRCSRGRGCVLRLVWFSPLGFLHLIPQAYVWIQFSVSMALFTWLIIRLIQFFFQPEQYFSLTKNQPTVFFSRLIIPAERGLYS
jgi:hypothetical protein